MGCCEKIFQVLLWIFNVVFFLTGIAVIVCGSIVIAREEYTSILNDNVKGTAIFLIIVGCVVTIVTFLGCCGAMKENKCMLYTYAALLCVIFIMEFAAGIAAFVYRGDISGDVNKQLNTTMYQYGQPDYEDVTEQWDKMQEDQKCCGIESSSDWTQTPYGPPYGKVPSSCCPDPQGQDCPESDIYPDGCADKMAAELDDNAVLIGGIAIGLCFVEILGIVISICLAKEAKDD